MQEIKVNIKLLNNANGKPEYGSAEAAGLDLRAGINKPETIKAHDFAMIPSGIVIELPSGFEAQVRPRSGLAAKHGISVLNTPGTIDSDYRGEIKIILINLGREDFEVLPNMKIAQLVISPVYKANLNFVKKIISNTGRGKRGFGSTGI